MLFSKNWGGPSASFQKNLGGGAGPPQAPMDGTPMPKAQQKWLALGN